MSLILNSALYFTLNANPENLVKGDVILLSSPSKVSVLFTFALANDSDINPLPYRYCEKVRIHALPVMLRLIVVTISNGFAFAAPQSKVSSTLSLIMVGAGCFLIML